MHVKHPRATHAHVAGGTRVFIGVLLAASASCIPGVAAAIDDSGNYAIWGQGSRSCHQFLKTVDEPEKKRYQDYTMGYLTAYNMLSEDTYSITGKVPLPQFIERLRLHCEGNQLDSFDRALKIVIAQQHDARLKTPTGNDKGWGRAPGRPGAETAM